METLLPHRKWQNVSKTGIVEASNKLPCCLACNSENCHAAVSTISIFCPKNYILSVLATHRGSGRNYLDDWSPSTQLHIKRTAETVGFKMAVVHVNFGELDYFITILFFSTCLSSVWQKVLYKSKVNINENFHALTLPR